MTANAVNDQGIIVGDYAAYCTSGCNATGQAATQSPPWMYQQSSGALDALPLDPSAIGGSASGIIDSGIIAGSQTIQGLQAAYWTVTGGEVLLGESGCSCWAVAATDDGTIVGDYGDSGFPGSAALV